MIIYIFDIKLNISLKNESVKSLFKKLIICYCVWFELLSVLCWCIKFFVFCCKDFGRLDVLVVMNFILL